MCECVPSPHDDDLPLNKLLNQLKGKIEAFIRVFCDSFTRFYVHF